MQEHVLDLASNFVQNPHLLNLKCDMAQLCNTQKLATFFALSVIHSDASLHTHWKNVEKDKEWKHLVGTYLYNPVTFYLTCRWLVHQNAKSVRFLRVARLRQGKMLAFALESGDSETVSWLLRSKPLMRGISSWVHEPEMRKITPNVHVGDAPATNLLSGAFVYLPFDVFQKLCTIFSKESLRMAIAHIISRVYKTREYGYDNPLQKFKHLCDIIPELFVRNSSTLLKTALCHGHFSIVEWLVKKCGWTLQQKHRRFIVSGMKRNPTKGEWIYWVLCRVGPSKRIVKGALPWLFKWKANTNLWRKYFTKYTRVISGYLQTLSLSDLEWDDEFDANNLAKFYLWFANTLPPCAMRQYIIEKCHYLTLTCAHAKGWLTHLDSDAILARIRNSVKITEAIALLRVFRDIVDDFTLQYILERMVHKRKLLKFLKRKFCVDIESASLRGLEVAQEMKETAARKIQRWWIRLAYNCPEIHTRIVNANMARANFLQ